VFAPANDTLRAVICDGGDGELIVPAGLAGFREDLGDALTIALLEAAGRGLEVHAINFPNMLQAMYELKERHETRERKSLKEQA